MMRFLSAIAAVLFLVLSRFPAYASPEVRKAANLMTMSEAALATIALLSQRFDARIEDFSWSVNFGEREWIATLQGKVKQRGARFTMVGYVWGEDGETLSVDFSGLGDAAEEPLVINGTATWVYDKDVNDYRAMDFRQVTKIGGNSFWGWVLGSEIIVGGVVGGVVAVGGSAAATGGLALGLAPWVAAGGAMGGAATLVTISAGAKSLLETNQTPPPPPVPARPNLPPKDGETLAPREGEMLVALSREHTISGSAIDGVHVLNGYYFLEKGSAQGSIRAVSK